MKITELRLAKLFSSRENISSTTDKCSTIVAKKAEGTFKYFVMFGYFKSTFQIWILSQKVALCSNCFNDCDNHCTILMITYNIVKLVKICLYFEPSYMSIFLLVFCFQSYVV